MTGSLAAASQSSNVAHVIHLQRHIQAILVDQLLNQQHPLRTGRQSSEMTNCQGVCAGYRQQQPQIQP